MYVAVMDIKLQQTDQHQHALPLPVQKYTTGHSQAKRGARQYDYDTNCSALSASYLYFFLRTRERTLAIIKHDQRLEIRIGIQQFTKLQTSFHFHWDLGEVKFYLILGDHKRKSQTGIGSPFPFPIPIPIWTDMHARD